MRIFTVLFGMCLMGLSYSATAQDFEIEAENATTLNGNIKVSNAGTELDGIKAVDAEGNYDGTITWAEYENVEIPALGNYTVSALTSGYQASTRITVSVDGTDVATLELLNTGGWGTYEWSSNELAGLPAGSHTIRLTFWHVGESTGFLCNVDKVNFRSGDYTSVNDIAETNVSVYPTPASDVVFIDLDGKEDAMISAYSLSGQEVISGQQISGKGEINVSSLKSGIYLLKIEMKDGIINRKLIVE